MRGDLSTVHRAIFGDVKGAHNVVSASAGAPALVISDLASYYSDRLLPIEVPWESYVCGFPLRDSYVLTRTFAVKATRSGMVQTHAAILELQTAGEPSLSSLLRLLPVEPLSTVPSLAVDDASLEYAEENPP